MINATLITHIIPITRETKKELSAEGSCRRSIDKSKSIPIKKSEKGLPISTNHFFANSGRLQGLQFN